MTGGIMIAPFFTTKVKTRSAAEHAYSFVVSFVKSILIAGLSNTIMHGIKACTEPPTASKFVKGANGLVGDAGAEKSSVQMFGAGCLVGIAGHLAAWVISDLCNFVWIAHRDQKRKQLTQQKQSEKAEKEDYMLSTLEQDKIVVFNNSRENAKVGAACIFFGGLGAALGSLFDPSMGTKIGYFFLGNILYLTGLPSFKKEEKEEDKK